MGENRLIFALEPKLEKAAETLVLRSGPKFMCSCVSISTFGFGAKQENLKKLMQGRLKIWTEDSHIDFVNLTQVKISKNDSNIICTSTKVVALCKILRVWLKN